MARSKRDFQASLLLDLRGRSPFRGATLRSALAARRSCEKAGISLELLVRAEEGDELVSRLSRESPPDGWLGGSSPSEWIAESAGEYITILDAPGLITSNWVTDALALQTGAEQPLIALPEAVLFPETERKSVLRFDTLEQDAAWVRPAFAANIFGTLFLAHRRLFEELPLRGPLFEGHCPVWDWHCEALVRGFRHRTVPGAYHIVRSREAALRTGCFGAEPTAVPGPSSWHGRERKDDRPLSRRNHVPPELPVGMLVADLDAVAPDLCRLHLRGDWQHVFLRGETLESTNLFFDCLSELRAFPEYLVLHHVLSVGGSEKETLINLETIHRLRPRLKLAVITTENAPSPWAGRTPEDTTVLQFGILAGSLPWADRALLLLRLLFHLSPKVINNVISPLGWEVYSKWAGALATRSRLIATEFCVNTNTRGDREAFAYTHLPECREHVELLLTDNEALAKHLTDDFGFDRTQVLRFPPFVRIQKPVARAPGPMKVVWAGRFSRQKRLDVLYEIARRASAIEIHLYGTNTENDDCGKFVEDLARLKNVVFHGSYEHFEELLGKGYAALLYTSSWDGTPNIILEAIASGLPVIAPLIGGIPEVLKERCGYPVSDPEAVDEFLAALRSIEQDPETAATRARLAQSLVAFERNTQTFSAVWWRLLDRFYGTPREARPHAGQPTA